MGDQLVGMDGLLEWIKFYAERFLPPGEKIDGVVVETEVSERLVRHYITLEVLDRPDKDGRENRYSFRHVLQVLVALKARILTGISVKAMKGRLTRLTNNQLLSLLTHGLEVSFQPSSSAAIRPVKGNMEALRRIAEIRESSENSQATQRRPTSSSSWSEPPSSAPQVWWRRYALLDTLELQVRDDFRFPHSPAEESHLLSTIIEQLRRHTPRSR